MSVHQLLKNVGTNATVQVTYFLVCPKDGSKYWWQMPASWKKNTLNHSGNAFCICVPVKVCCHDYLQFWSSWTTASSRCRFLSGPFFLSNVLVLSAPHSHCFCLVRVLIIHIFDVKFSPYNPLLCNSPTKGFCCYQGECCHGLNPREFETQQSLQQPLGTEGVLPSRQIESSFKNTHHFDLNEITGLIENVIRKSPSMCPSGNLWKNPVGSFIN